MASITRSAFVADFSKRSLDLNNPAVVSKLAAAGADVGKLKALADGSGKVTGQKAAERVFLDVLDVLDNDHSLDTILSVAADGTKTPAGRLYDVLDGLFAKPVQTQIDNMIGERPVLPTSYFAKDCRNHAFQGKCAFTIDDGPNAKYTPSILDTLKERGVKATFFWTGQNIQANPKIVKRALLDGHEVACHTYKHPMPPELKTYTASQVKREMMLTQEALNAVIAGDPELQAKFPQGYKLTKFRAPGGTDTPAIQQACAEMNLGYFYWGVDTNDWRKGVDKVQQVFEPTELNGGATIGSRGGPLLIHDIHDNAAAIGQIIDRARDPANNFQVLSLDRLMEGKTHIA